MSADYLGRSSAANVITRSCLLGEKPGDRHLPLQGFEFVVQIADASTPCDRFIQQLSEDFVRLFAGKLRPVSYGKTYAETAEAVVFVSRT
jgi:hypothetical protein